MAAINGYAFENFPALPKSYCRHNKPFIVMTYTSLGAENPTGID